MRRGEIDHSYAGAKYLYNLALQSQNQKAKSAASFISRTIISHHGLQDWLEEDGTEYFKKRIGKTERYEEIMSNASAFLNEVEILKLLDKSAEELSVLGEKCKDLSKEDDGSKTKQLFYSGMTERLMQSVLVDADRTDTSCFMSNSEEKSKFEKPDYIQETWKKIEKRLLQKYKEFSEPTNDIDKMRSEISDKCLDFANHKVGICRLIVPTGGGKTLSSLRFAVAQCKKYQMDKIFYIAPFMSILEQNSDVIKKIAGEENFLEHYTDFEQQLNDDNELAEYELRAEKWDSPVISTTLVQFLNTIFSNKSASVRRFHRLCNSVIIVDEVQSIPLKCINLFNLAINFLSKICGCAVVLCTATQPTLNKTEYPLLLDNDRDMIVDYEGYFEKFRRTRVVPQLKIQQYTYEQAADFCSEKFEENRNLLFVVNTKKAASTVYFLLKEKYINSDVKVLHLSTGMCPEHRRRVIDEIRNSLSNNESIICVTTQLIEAGVDISFKCVIRSLAGLDNIAQAAGRCNRNGEYSCCDVYVINLKDENLSNLPDIRSKQGCTEYVLGKKYDDLLSINAVEDFFEQFYFEQRDELSYNVTVDDSETNIVKLLSVNTDRKARWAAKRNKNAGICRGFQAFKTAGEKFNVIDSCTEEVIVPYNDEAKNLILDLNSDISFEEMKKKLKKAQKYTLSLYSNQINGLKKESCIEYLKCGVMALKDGYYDSDGIGLDIKGKDPDGIFF